MTRALNPDCLEHLVATPPDPGCGRPCTVPARVIDIVARAAAAPIAHANVRAAAQQTLEGDGTSSRHCRHPHVLGQHAR